MSRGTRPPILPTSSRMHHFPNSRPPDRFRETFGSQSSRDESSGHRPLSILWGRGRGFDMGSITVPDRALQRQKKPSVTLVFCKLRPSFSLSRERPRDRARLSPPYTPKNSIDMYDGI